MKRRQLNATAALLSLGLGPCLSTSMAQALQRKDAGGEPATPGLHGFSEHLPPLNFQRPGEAPSGFAVELLRMIAEQAKLPLTMEVMPWPRAASSAAARPGSVLFSLTRQPEREQHFKWLGPISERRIVVYRLSARTEVKASDIRHLNGHKLGVVRESAAAQLLLSAGLRPDVELEVALDDASNLRKLLAGRMDLLVMLDWAAAWNLQQMKLPFATLQPVFELDSSKSYWYGLHPDTRPALQQTLQTALDQIKRDGRYAALRQQYFR